MSDREAVHAALAQRYLPPELLTRIRTRAGAYDAQNRFFDEDFAELVDAGYLQLFVPERLGGPGLSLNQAARLQQRLASAAPATALALNMHLLCTGVVHAMAARGDHSLDYVLEQSLAGEVFAFGISEPANDWVLHGSNSRAQREPDGGYRVSGVKIFTSLAPVWTQLLVHALDASDSTNPRLVYGLVARDDPGVAVSARWDTLGMRATRSQATVLDQARIGPDRVARVMAAGRGYDLLKFAITANFQLLVAAVYAGLAQRALEVAAAGLRRRRSAMRGCGYAEIPEYRARLADAYRDYLPVTAQIDAYTRDLDELTDHGDGWSPRLVSARIAASTAARRCAETALACTGGAGYDNDHEASRLYRDAAASLFHPPSADDARPLYAAALLDVDPPAVG